MRDLAAVVAADDELARPPRWRRGDTVFVHMPSMLPVAVLESGELPALDLPPRTHRMEHDGIGRVRVHRLIFDVVDGNVVGPLPARIDWTGRTLTLAESLGPGQRGEILAAVVEQVHDRLCVPLLGTVAGLALARASPARRDGLRVLPDLAA
ncbi:MAG: hypothetical protein AAGD32_06155 [Planctomycetota bacterium]